MVLRQSTSKLLRMSENVTTIIDTHDHKLCLSILFESLHRLGSYQEFSLEVPYNYQGLFRAPYFMYLLSPQKQ